MFAFVMFSPVMAIDFKLEMPVRMQDIAQGAYGIVPFGVHGGSHAADGNPGFDIEFKYGSYVYAAADGVVLSVAPDMHNADAMTVQLKHRGDGTDYITTYSNVVDMAPSIAVGIPVQVGQTLGKAGSQTVLTSQSPVTLQMIHFQIDDLSATNPGANPNAVSPELFLSGNGLAVLKEIWKTARYGEALCEPYITNPSTGPAMRNWTISGGKGAPRIQFTRTDNNSLNYQYVFLEADPSTKVLETGTATVDPYKYDYPAIDFQPTPGQNIGGFGPRLGLFEARGDTMKLDYSQPGMSRPNDLNKASIYTTIP